MSYSPDYNAWSNIFNKILWSDVPTSESRESWFPVVLNNDMAAWKQSHELVFATDTAYDTSLDTIRFSS